MHPKAWADKKEKKGVEEKGGEEKKKGRAHTQKQKERLHLSWPGYLCHSSEVRCHNIPNANARTAANP